MRALFAAAALCGCGASAPELTAPERVGVAAAVSAWVESGLPAPDPKRCELSHVSVLHVELEEACPSLAASSEIHFACLAWESVGWFGDRRRPVLVMRPGLALDADAEPVVHEMMHALYRCSGLPYWTPANTGHLDARVWSSAGGAQSAQAIARRRVRGGE